MPHLIIIDGGKGQLSSALAGIDDGVRAYREQNISRMKNEK
jgi:excinuclease UvrABC nuclease subunit